MSQLRDLFFRGIESPVLSWHHHLMQEGVVSEREGNTGLSLLRTANGRYEILYISEREPVLRSVHLEGVVYVAGPMRGIAKHNFPAFDTAASRLREAGFYTFNPADFDRSIGLTEETKDEDVTQSVLRQCFDRDLNAITKCTHLALLPGWEGSSGVRPEAMLADVLGLHFLAIENDGHIHDVDPAAVLAVIGARLAGRYKRIQEGLPPLL